MMATWSQSEDSFDDENEKEVAKMCFMALKDQDEVNSNFDDDEFMIEYDELHKDINKLDEKNTSLLRLCRDILKLCRDNSALANFMIFLLELSLLH